MIRTALVLVVAVAGPGNISPAQTSAPCEDAKVEYRPAPAALQQKIQLTDGAKPPVEPKSPQPPKPAQPAKSPQGTRWFDEVDPDYTSTKEPWNTTLYVYSADSRNPVLKMEFLDHGNTFKASWINEKLLFAEVWWGRFASSDLIIDVETRKVIYHELANYFELGLPCNLSR